MCAALSWGDEGTLAGSKQGNILVDMTTSEPSLAEEIAAAAEKKGVRSIDRAGVRGRRGRTRGTLVDHDRRRQRNRRAVASLLGGHGEDDRPSRRGRRRPAHQDGQSGIDRLEHGRRLRSTVVRLSCRTRFAHGLAIGQHRSSRELVVIEPGTADHRQQLRPGVCSSSISSKTWASRWPSRNVLNLVTPGSRLRISCTLRWPRKVTRATARTRSSWPWRRCQGLTGKTAKTRSRRGSFRSSCAGFRRPDGPSFDVHAPRPSVRRLRRKLAYPSSVRLVPSRGLNTRTNWSRSTHARRRLRSVAHPSAASLLTSNPIMQSDQPSECGRRGATRS